jgi:KAP family P-loop domain
MSTENNREPINPESRQSVRSDSAPVIAPFMPSLLDREIHSADADAFGHLHFTKALESLVESQTHRPPYSIGLLGKWGTGKSSIKSLYLDGLNQDRRKDPCGLFRSQKIRAITFNAWRFGGENIRRALLRHVYLELGGDEATLMDTLFNQVQKPTQVPKSWKEIWREVYDKWLWTLVQVLVVAAVLLGLAWLAAEILSLEDEWVIATILGIQSLLVGMLLKYLLDAKRFAISRYATINRVELPTISAEQFEKLLVDKIVEYHKNAPECERLVVFVDDLDRLSAEEMVNGLDAIRTFMEIPHEDRRLAEIGLVFVISCDEDRIADALANKRKELSSDLPGVILTRTDARRYLDRIFQFRLEIPPFPRQDMRSFALQKLQSELPTITEGVLAQGVSIEEVVSRMIHVGVQSPRNAIHIVNAFVESWWVAGQRERAGAGTDKRGALSEGAVTKHPLALAALCALRVDFPDFYGDLQREPDLITRFLEVFVHKKPMAEQPEGVRLILEKYAMPRPDAESTANAPAGLRSQMRPLRQYLTSVAAIPWPLSLQPLLLLSQDPVSRQIGDAGQRIYESFVSGDVEGVLADLGRDKDDRKLEASQMRWLRDLVEQIEGDTIDRRDNAGAVLAALVERYPREEASHLLIPLARQVAGSESLRARIGVDKIPPILPLIPQSDQQRVVGSFVRDFLRSSDEIGLDLPTGETPSLDEAIAMCRTVTDFALSVRSEGRLDPSIDRQLLDWLLVRHVGVSAKTYQIPFAELEGWMDVHERHLLPDLSVRYLEALAEMLEDGETYKELDLSGAARRSESVLAELWGAGEESRKAAWQLVNRYVHVRAVQANQVSQRFFRVHGEQANSQVASVFIRNAADRVRQFLSEEPLDEADTDAVNLLVAVLPNREGIVPDALSKVSDLCIGLAAHNDKAHYAVNLTEALLKAAPAEGGRVLADWATRAATDLPDLCLDLLARGYSTDLDTQTQQALTAQLTSVVQSEQPEEEEARRYLRLIAGFPEEAFQEEFLRAHVAALLSRITQKHADRDYLETLFPAVPRIVGYGPSAEVVQMLHTLMSSARNTPDVYGFLHSIMKGNWPKPDESLGRYKPESIFAWAQDFAQTNPNAKDVEAALLSMESMVQDGVVDESLEPGLVSTAIALWPYRAADAATVLQRAATLPSVEESVGLVAHTPPDDEKQVDYLRQVWRHITDKLNFSQRVTFATLLLGELPVPLGGQPDGYLYLWSEQVGSDIPEIFKAILNSDMNDEQKLRMWKQVEARIADIDQGKILSLLKLALTSTSDIARSALDTAPEIDNLFSSKEAKFELGRELMMIFPASLNLESKNRIAQWLRNMGNQEILRFASDGSFNREDIRILLEYFPASKRLQRLVPE